VAATVDAPEQPVMTRCHATPETAPSVAGRRTFFTDRDLGIWQRFAGKWATGATGQKPCTLADIPTVDFKGF
jgi:hypothetical protein